MGIIRALPVFAFFYAIPVRGLGRTAELCGTFLGLKWKLKRRTPVKLIRTFSFLFCAAICVAQNAAVTVQVDAQAGRHPINPLIYGTNYADAAALADLNVPVHRLGGNNTSRYNWRINADNRGRDWYFESIAEADATAAGRANSFYSMNKAAGAESMFTIPLIGWVAKLGTNRAKLSSFSISKYGAQADADWQWFPDAGNGVRSGGGYVTGNDPNDANVLFSSADQREFVQQMVTKWGSASQGGIRYYVLDNEHSIWFDTHRDVAPVGKTGAEMRDLMLDYANAIKTADPTAMVVGPEEWGWSGYVFSGYDQQWGSKNGWSNLPDRQTMGGQDYLPWLLAQWKSLGKKPVDVFSVHYYPQGGEFSNDTSSTMQLRRNQSTRSLWDPNYVDQTWINDKVRLIPRMKGWVQTYYYAGTPTAITEYNWGAEGHINGATTQADILGIFGREGLDMATRWSTPASTTPTYKAMKMYRNYDGNKSGFGDTAVSASAPSPDSLSAFAAQRTSDGALTVMVINKVLSGSTPVTLNLSGFSGNGSAQVWQLTSANAIQRLGDLSYTGAAMSATVPPQSVTLFVLPASTGNQAPKAVISANPLTGTAPLTVSFSGAGSTDADGSIAKYEWNFGNGATATGVTTTYTYTAAGSYTATLKVTDNLGAVSTASTVITAGAPPAACAVTYAIVNDWGNGFQANVTIQNTGGTAINGWTLKWSFGGSQKITGLWNGKYTQSAKAVTVVNETWNGSITPGASAQIGFNANYKGTNAKPTAFTLNGKACNVK